jgi:hypothetical protein
MSFSVKIYKPSRNAMQSGQAKTKAWVLEPDLMSARIPEPLMGWQSSEDTLNQIRLNFATSEEAVAFAKHKGWSVTLEQPQAKKVKPRCYADNFK